MFKNMIKDTAVLIVYVKHAFHLNQIHQCCSNTKKSKGQIQTFNACVQLKTAHNSASLYFIDFNPFVSIGVMAKQRK